MKSDTTLAMIGPIHETAYDPSRWTTVMVGLAQLFDAQAAVLVQEELRTRRALMRESPGLSESQVKEYNEYYAARNVWVEAGRADPAMMREGVLLTSEMLVPEADLLRSEYYHGFLKKIDVQHLIASTLQINPECFSHLSIVRSKRAGPFDAQEARMLALLVPHIQQALRLRQRLESVELERDVALDALDRFPMGVLVIGAVGRLLAANRAAKLILDSKDGLSLDRDGLRAARADDTTALRALIGAAARTGNGSGIHPGGSMVLGRPSSKRSLEVLVVPLRHTGFDLGPPRSAAIVFLHDPESGGQNAEELLRRIHGLTPAEARVAMLLMGGKSIEEAAAACSTAVATTRTYMKHLLLKTGTRRQSELMRLLLRGVSSLRIT